jgi:hypothetical protein
VFFETRRIFILLSLGPIIYNIIGIHIYNIYKLERKICNFIGLLSLYSYYIGAFITIILAKYSSIYIKDSD